MVVLHLPTPRFWKSAKWLLPITDSLNSICFREMAIRDLRGLGVLLRRMLSLWGRMSLPWAKNFLNSNALITHPLPATTTRLIRKDVLLPSLTNQPEGLVAVRVAAGMITEWIEGRIQWQASCCKRASLTIWLARSVPTTVQENISAITSRAMGQSAGRITPASNTLAKIVINLLLWFFYQFVTVCLNPSFLFQTRQYLINCDFNWILSSWSCFYPLTTLSQNLQCMNPDWSMVNSIGYFALGRVSTLSPLCPKSSMNESKFKGNLLFWFLHFRVSFL